MITTTRKVAETTLVTYTAKGKETRTLVSNAQERNPLLQADMTRPRLSLQMSPDWTP